MSAFRMSGTTGVVSDRNEAEAKLEEIVRKGEAGIIAVTKEIAEGIEERIRKINLTLPAPLVITIPGIDEAGGFGKSVISYISEALGISM